MKDNYSMWTFVRGESVGQLRYFGQVNTKYPIDRESGIHLLYAAKSKYRTYQLPEQGRLWSGEGEPLGAVSDRHKQLLPQLHVRIIAAQLQHIETRGRHGDLTKKARKTHVKRAKKPERNMIFRTCTWNLQKRI